MTDSVWEEILVGQRSGFEPLFGPLPRFLHSVYAEALDSEGHVVGVTEARETFVPSKLTMKVTISGAMRWSCLMLSKANQGLISVLVSMPTSGSTRNALLHNSSILSGGLHVQILLSAAEMAWSLSC